MNCILLPKNAKSISDPTQVTHIKEILKSKVGDSLTIGEICGNIGKATIAQINNNEILLTDIILNKPPPAKLDLTVILALPRPKVLRRLIMDMTSLGINKLIIVNSYQSEKSYWQSPLLNRIDELTCSHPSRWEYILKLKMIILSSRADQNNFKTISYLCIPTEDGLE